MLVVAQNPDYAPQNTNQIKDIKRVEHHCFSDSQGNSRLVTVANHWQVLSLGAISYTKFMGRSVFQRDVVRQPLQLCNMSDTPQPVVIVQAPSGAKALPSMSIVVHNANPLTPNIFSFVVQRSDLADNPIVQLVDMVVRVVQLATAGMIEEAGRPSDTSEARSNSHSGYQGCSAGLPHERLISELLPNAIDHVIQERLDTVQKVLDLSNLEKMLLLAGKEGFSLDADSLRSLSELNNQYTFASEQQDSSIQQKFNPESFKSGAENTINYQADRGSLGEQVKSLGQTDNPHHELKNGERFTGSRENSGNEAGKTSHFDVGNKPGVNNNGAIQMMPGQGVSVLNQSSNILASNLSVVIQPQPMDSGQKQLPPIILPNTPGTGSSSGRRRKSRKEIKEEEEKEREGGSYLFDDDPADDDLLEDE